MSLYSKPVYPELSNQERETKTIFARTYDSLIQILRLRDASMQPIPARLADDSVQKSMNLFLG